MRKKESLIENQSFTCPNPLCGKAFVNPLKAENLGSKNVEVYHACPYCLTEILLEETQPIVEKSQEITEEIEIKEPKLHSTGKKLAKTDVQVQGCTHHFGYLGERSSKEKIPEGCMTCERIVQCMLKNVTS